MMRWTPWTIALTAACVAVAVVLWRRYDWEERQYVAFVAEVTDDAMTLLAVDPLASRPDTQRAVRIAAAAADAGHYYTAESAYALALQYQREGNMAAAAALLEEIVADHPDWSWPYALLGSIVGQSGPDRLDEAEALLRQAIALEPDWARPYSSLGVVLRLMGRYEEAEEMAALAIELAPHDIASHNNYANLMVVLERYEEAETHYAYAMELEPNNPKPPYNLACLYSTMERVEDALYLLELAIELDEEARRYAAVDTYFSNLYDLPEFQQLVYGVNDEEDAVPAEYEEQDVVPTGEEDTPSQ